MVPKPPGSSAQHFKKVNWTQEDLVSAIKAVRSGCSIRSTAKNYNVPKSTLSDYLLVSDNRNIRWFYRIIIFSLLMAKFSYCSLVAQCFINYFKSNAAGEDNKLGRKPALGEQNEIELSSHLICLAKRGLPLSRKTVKELAYKFCSENEVPHPFSR